MQYVWPNIQYMKDYSNLTKEEVDVILRKLPNPKEYTENNFVVTHAWVIDNGIDRPHNAYILKYNFVKKNQEWEFESMG